MSHAQPSRAMRCSWRERSEKDLASALANGANDSWPLRRWQPPRTTVQPAVLASAAISSNRRVLPIPGSPASRSASAPSLAKCRRNCANSEARPISGREGAAPGSAPWRRARTGWKGTRCVGLQHAPGRHAPCRQPQRFGEQCNRALIGGTAYSALESADPARTHARSFGQRLLREARSEPMAPEQLAKTQGVCGCHNLSSLSHQPNLVGSEHTAISAAIVACAHSGGDAMANNCVGNCVSGHPKCSWSCICFHRTLDPSRQQTGHMQLARAEATWSLNCM